MKFGVILNRESGNLTDDIQTYCAFKLLPRVDYVIDREHADTFQSNQDEKVAVIANGWWLWNKWNWPPAKCIIPKLIGFSVNLFNVSQNSPPISDEWLEGIGGEFFKSYSPIGVSNRASLKYFEKRGIDAYYSSNLILTLPKLKKNVENLDNIKNSRIANKKGKTV